MTVGRHFNQSMANVILFSGLQSLIFGNFVERSKLWTNSRYTLNNDGKVVGAIAAVATADVAAVAGLSADATAGKVVAARA